MKKYPTTNKSVRTLNTGTKSSEDHQLTKTGVLKQNHRIFKSLRWINLDEPLTFHIFTLYKKLFHHRMREVKQVFTPKQLHFHG